MAAVDNRITGRLALVTGASGGIGGACAKSLHAQGVHLALTYSSNKASLETLVADLRAAETAEPRDGILRISMHRVDIGSEEDIANLFKEIEKEHGTHVDILISNAGRGKRIVDILDIPVDEFEYTWKINVRAAFILTKAVVPAMKAQKWGRIVYISSIAAYGAGINGCHYASSKGGLTSMMKNLSQTLSGYNISINDVSPAMIGDTGMIPNSAAVPGVMEGIPLGRLGTPQEVANAVDAFVKSGYITGQSLLVAGGLRHL